MECFSLVCTAIFVVVTLVSLACPPSCPAAFLVCRNSAFSRRFFRLGSLFAAVSVAVDDESFERVEISAHDHRAADIRGPVAVAVGHKSVVVVAVNEESNTTSTSSPKSDQFMAMIDVEVMRSHFGRCSRERSVDTRTLHSLTNGGH